MFIFLLVPVGSAWFSQEEAVKGRLKAGQLADIVVLNAPYLDVSDEDLRHIESEMTIMNGKIVYGAGPFASEMSPLGPIEPAWSPVLAFGGYCSS